MEILQASKILDIDNITRIDKSDLKSKFRTLMKKNHPDLGGCAEKARLIIEANNTILNAINQLELIRSMEEMTNNKGIITIIPLDKLVDIYNGGSVKAGYELEQVVIDKKNLRKNRVIVDANCEITLGENIYKFNKLNQLNMRDEYSILCTIQDNDMDKPRDINVKAHGKSVDLVLNNSVTKLVLNYDSILKLSITIERKNIRDE